MMIEEFKQSFVQGLGMGLGIGIVFLGARMISEFLQGLFEKDGTDGP